MYIGDRSRVNCDVIYGHNFPAEIARLFSRINNNLNRVRQ